MKSDRSMSAIWQDDHQIQWQQAARKSRTGERLVWPLVIFGNAVKLQTTCLKADNRAGYRY
jgi:hypothetical protein